MSEPYVLLGGGGHASVLLDTLLECGASVVGIISPEPITKRKVFCGVVHFSSDEEFKAAFIPGEVGIVNGIGPTPKSNLRQQLQLQYESCGYQFFDVISPLAVISRFSEWGNSVQVMAGATLQTGVKLGKASVINTGAVLDHDCVVGDYTHVAPGATLCGGVVLADNVYVGANATIFPGVNIGCGAIIGAGTIVTEDVDASGIVFPPRSVARKIN